MPYENHEVTRLILDTHDAATLAQRIMRGNDDVKYCIKNDTLQKMWKRLLCLLDHFKTSPHQAQKHAVEPAKLPA